MPPDGLWPTALNGRILSLSNGASFSNYVHYDEVGGSPMAVRLTAIEAGQLFRSAVDCCGHADRKSKTFENAADFADENDDNALEV